MVDLFDGGFLRVLLQGPRALPNDIEKLGAYLGVIHQLLEVQAQEVGDDWESELERNDETTTLLDLEEKISMKISEISARTPWELRQKLAVWGQLIAVESDEYESTLRDGIVKSAWRDLEAFFTSGGCSVRSDCILCPRNGA